MDKTKIVLGILVLIVLAGWITRWSLYQDRKITAISATPVQKDDSTSSVTLVSPSEFARLAENSNAFIIDVHTPEQTHIPGTDAVYTFYKIQNAITKMPIDKSTPILVYCRSGSMSAQASKEIAQLGFTNVYDLEGGTTAYKEQQVSVQLWPQKQELGTVIYDEVSTTQFTLTNYTPLPTKVTRVSTSCGCTKASIEKEELEAYESTTVTVTFNPAVHGDDTDLGAVTRTIYIETDNPNYPNLESSITANVTKKN